MISAQGYSAIMRKLGRIEGIALCEEEDIRAGLILNVDRICEILEAERDPSFGGADSSPYRGADAPARCRADLIRTLPIRALAGYLAREVGGDFDWLGWLTEPIGRKRASPSSGPARHLPPEGEGCKEGDSYEKEPRTP